MRLPTFGVDIFAALPVFVLIVFRLTGLVMTAPILASEMIPLRIRAALTMVMAFVLFPAVSLQAPGDLGVVTMLTGGVTELAIGATIGLALNMLMTGAELAGLLVGQQGGIGLGQVYDPALGGEVSIVGQLYTIVLVFVFLVIGGHRAMVSALLDTFQAVPLLTGRFGEPLVVLLVEMLASAFMLAIRVAGPVLVALFLTTVAMGFLSRTMPQMNIMTVGFQVQILVALGVSGLALVSMQDLFVGVLWDAIARIRETFDLGVT